MKKFGGTLCQRQKKENWIFDAHVSEGIKVNLDKKQRMFRFKLSNMYYGVLSLDLKPDLFPDWGY